GEDRGGAEAVSEAFGRRALCQDRRTPSDKKADHIAEIMPGIGQERGGIGENAVRRLDRDKAEVERDPDGEGAADVFRRVSVRVAGVGVGMRVPGRVRMAGIGLGGVVHAVFYTNRSVPSLPRLRWDKKIYSAGRGPSSSIQSSSSRI